MKIDKENLLMVELIVSAVVCAPFIGAYYGMKWIYNQTSKQKRIRKERKVDERAERERLDSEIKELESQLGLVGRLTGTLDYDPYYYKRNSSRKEYWESLKKKVSENYQSSDIILAIKETKGGICCSMMNSVKCQVLMLANKHVYKVPPHTGEMKVSLFYQNADEYFRFFYNCIHFADDLSEGRLYTLSECGRYEDYFVMEIPGEFEYWEVGMGNETIKQFVEDFKKKYRKSVN